jgi:hypothetical protein
VNQCFEELIRLLIFTWQSIQPGLFLFFQR